MQRASICMSPSPRQASAQAVQLCSQSKQAWMHSTNALGSTAAPLGCVSSIRRVWLLKAFLYPVATPNLRASLILQVTISVTAVSFE
jgi:hypothetical protein